MVSDEQRRALYDAFVATMGRGPANTMMELLPPVGWGDVARQSDITALRGEMAELRGELKAEIAQVRGELAELRGEMRSQLARLYAANLVSSVALAGLVLAAVQLG